MTTIRWRVIKSIFRAARSGRKVHAVPRDVAPGSATRRATSESPAGRLRRIHRSEDVAAGLHLRTVRRRACARPTRWISTTCCSKPSGCWRTMPICAARYNRRFEFVMIDEYQDTNRSQYELMRLLTEAHKNVAVVGDEDQSIYGWRGADIRNILDFEHDYPNADRDSAGTELPLHQKHSRSRQRGGREQHRAQGQVAVDRIRRGRAARPLRSLRRRAGSAVHRRHDRASCCRRIPDERVAVLYRTNFQSRQIEEALRRYGRDYVVLGGFSFYQRAEVKDALVVSEDCWSARTIRSACCASSTRRRAASARAPSSRSSNTRSQHELQRVVGHRPDAGGKAFPGARRSGAAVRSRA